MSTRQELEETLHCYTNIINKNVKIVTPDDLKHPKLFHIATLKFDSLVPNISRRGAWTEDNTLPRVHCSTSLYGCIVGYASLFHTAINELVGTSKKNDYKGGFYIYQLPFDFALKPNKKLVYDADETGELWLVSYNRETRFYKPDVIGKFVVIRVTIEKGESKWVRQERLELAVDVPKGMILPLMDDIVLSEGYWSVKLDRCIDKSGKATILLNEHKPMMAGEFDNLKKEKATLLSYR